MSVAARKTLVRRGKDLFRIQLEQAEIELPKERADIYVAAFEIAISEILSSLVLDDMVDDENVRARQANKPKTPRPTDRLRRAMSSANRIERGRFATIDDLLQSLGQTKQI